MSKRPNIVRNRPGGPESTRNQPNHGPNRPANHTFQLSPEVKIKLIRMGCADFDPPKSAISGKLLKISNFGPLGPAFKSALRWEGRGAPGSARMVTSRVDYGRCAVTETTTDTFFWVPY